MLPPVDLPRLAIRLFDNIIASDKPAATPPTMDVIVYVPRHLCAPAPMLPLRIRLCDTHWCSELLFSGVRIDTRGDECNRLCRRMLLASSGVVPLVHELAAAAKG